MTKRLLVVLGCLTFLLSRFPFPGLSAQQRAMTIEDYLPRGARVGTSSLRRAVQLLAERPDLIVVPVRGNVQTRLARATGATVVRGGVEVRPAEGDPQGPLDAVVLALAGLRRLGLDGEVTEILPPELSLPAAGQGALAIETLRGSPGLEPRGRRVRPGVAPRRDRRAGHERHQVAG